MLDGLDHFWRMRPLIDISALRRRSAQSVLPFIRDWAESAEGFSGRQVFRGFSQIQEMRRGRGRGDATVRLRAHPDRADDGVPGGMGLAEPRSH